MHTHKHTQTHNSATHTKRQKCDSAHQTVLNTKYSQRCRPTSWPPRHDVFVVALAAPAGGSEHLGEGGCNVSEALADQVKTAFLDMFDRYFLNEHSTTQGSGFLFFLYTGSSGGGDAKMCKARKHVNINVPYFPDYK